MNSEAFSKITAAGKAAYADHAAKLTSKAKSAKVPKTKAAFVGDLIPQPEEDGFRLHPGEFALCRRAMGGDIYAALLLYRIKHLWLKAKKKLERHGREWLANSRADWARSAGLSDSEMANSALPRLKKQALGFVEVRQFKLGDKKMLWINVNEPALQDALYGQSAMPLDMYEPMLNGAGIFPPKPPKNAYKKAG